MTLQELKELLGQAAANGMVYPDDAGGYSVADLAVIIPEKYRTSEGFFTVERPTGRFILKPIDSDELFVLLHDDEVAEIFAESCAAQMPTVLRDAQMEMTEFGPVPFLGEGYEAIYAYTTSECKAQGLTKIGMSSSASVRGVVSRIRQQFGTANPSPPEILLVVRVDDGYRMEQAIHGFLASKRISGPGTEWFRVSIEEVVVAYRACLSRRD